MKEHKVLITYEAIYDIADAEEYIFYEFGQERANEYHTDIYNEIKSFANFCSYSSSGCCYRGYAIFKKPFKPAIIFGIIISDEIHILRVVREEYDWQEFFNSHQHHEYHYPDNNPIIQ